MAQTVILASAQTVATSTDAIVGAAGILTLFTAAGPIPPNIMLGVYQVANAVERAIGALSSSQPSMTLPGPGTYRVKRTDISAFGINVGVTVDLSDPMAIAASASAGASSYHHLVAAATTNATSVKGAAGNLAFALLSNPSAAVKFVKFFNKATAPVPGTDTPIITVLVPAGGTVGVATGPSGILFTAGIAYSITNLAADLDATAVAAGDVIVNLAYA